MIGEYATLRPFRPLPRHTKKGEDFASPFPVCGCLTRHVHYGPLLPGFARYMTALTALEFGQSAEIPAT